jgi:hypothetical protein
MKNGRLIADKTKSAKRHIPKAEPTIDEELIAFNLVFHQPTLAKD